jgi:hypothetical protein
MDITNIPAEVDNRPLDEAYIKQRIEELAPTIGGVRVRLRFNPSESLTVALLKIKAVEFMNLCEVIKQEAKSHPTLAGNVAQAGSTAQTHVEAGAMFAVKAATYLF